MLFTASLIARDVVYPETHRYKVAFLVESRPLPHLAPLLLHFIYSLPHDWSVRFMGSEASIAAVKKSAAIREHIVAGKLDQVRIPSTMTVNGQEAISRFLTTLRLYDTILRPAEHLLVFQTDSMICSNSRHNVDDYLEYDWIGAPWNPEGAGGGNGGLSLRRVSSLIDVLRDEQRRDNSEPEDIWFSQRLQERPGSSLANGSISLMFSGEMHAGEPEHVFSAPSHYQSVSHKKDSISKLIRAGNLVEGIDDWRDGHYEPMGYHIGIAKQMHPHVWGTLDQREHIWKYCPEVKMILEMDMVDFVPGNCEETFS